MLSVEDLLVGEEAVHDIEVPAHLLPGATSQEEPARDPRVRLRPLTVRDLRLITRAARENEDITAALMVRQALVEPALSLEQLGAMPAGLMQHLLREVNRISGITASQAEIAAAMEDPLVQATLLLSRELGWTTEEVGRLTMGEAMLHVAALRSGT